MHLFNVKQLFSRRRKYDRVLGGAQDEGRQLDLLASPTRKHEDDNNTQSNKISGLHYHLSTQAQEMRSEHATSKGSSATAAASSSSSNILWGFKMRPKLRMRKQKSLKLVSTSSNGPQLSQAAVQNFLQGPCPSQEDEIYNQQCRDLLRKLSARGNRVPGFI